MVKASPDPPVTYAGSGTRPTTRHEGGGFWESDGAERFNRGWRLKEHVLHISQHSSQHQVTTSSVRASCAEKALLSYLCSWISSRGSS